MTTPTKKLFRDYREKLLFEVNSSISELNSKIDVTNQRLLNIEEKIRFIDSQLSNFNKVQTIQVSENILLTKLFTDLKIYLNPKDMAVAVHLALDGIWEKEITKAWISVLKPNYTILDIGANFGYYGLLAGQFTDKNESKIIMFEANKKLIPYINKSISINWFNESTKVENLAISDKPGSVKLNILKDYVGSSSIQSVHKLETYLHDKMQLELAESVEVESVSIDDYCDSYKIQEVNLIKMDIEGYEETAYKGMRKIIKKSKNITLFIEFTKDGYKDPKAFYQNMISDFGNVYIINKDGALIKQKDDSYNNVIGNNKDNWVMPVFSKNPNLA